MIKIPINLFFIFFQFFCFAQGIPKDTVFIKYQDQDNDTLYIEGGVEELGIDRLSDLLELKYQGVLEGQQVLGNIDTIKKLFIDFQKHLY